MERFAPGELTHDQIRQRNEAISKLQYPPVSINGEQALAIANGFRQQSETSKYNIWACSILPEHTHLVVARHTYKSEQIINLLKGAATRSIIEAKLHPLQQCTKPGNRPPRMWAAGEWKVYLDSEEAILNAIRYVEQNPIKENKPPQNWSFVKPFEGLDNNASVTYH